MDIRKLRGAGAPCTEAMALAAEKKDMSACRVTRHISSMCATGTMHRGNGVLKQET